MSPVERDRSGKMWVDEIGFDRIVTLACRSSRDVDVAFSTLGCNGVRFFRSKTWSCTIRRVREGIGECTVDERDVTIII